MSNHSTVPRSSRIRLTRGSSNPFHLKSSEHQTNSAGLVHFKPRKRFGQHFLTDQNILRQVVQAAEVQEGDVVLEIGPGLGHLTRALLEAGARVVAIEIDRDLVSQLKHASQDTRGLKILEGDFLANSPEEWLARAQLDESNYKVAANLPYYITSAVLRHLLEAGHQPTLLAIMVQLEVAQEITARPDNMNLLAISVQYYGRPRIILHVPAGAFYPRPKVNSAIVRIEVDHPSRFPETDPSRFFELVRAGFAVRRKQLHNALGRGLGMNAEEVNARLLRSGIDPRRRAETLSLEDWLQVYRYFPKPAH